MQRLALTGGELPGLEWPGPEQESADDVKIVAAHIVHTEKELRDAQERATPHALMELMRGRVAPATAAFFLAAACPP